MTPPVREREPRRGGAVLGIVASLALHAAALAAVIAGSGDRAPQAPGNVVEIAVDVVAPPAPAPATAEAPAPEAPAPAAQAAEASAGPPPLAEPAPIPEPAPDAAPAVIEPAPVTPPARKPKPAQAQAAAASPPRPSATAPAASSAAPGPAPAATPAAVPMGPTLAAAPLNSPQPHYPATARRRGQQGRVVLSVRVSPAGTPEAVVLVASSGVEALDEAARDAVRGWRFRPALDKGVAVAATVEVPVRFRLEED